ncbi:GNAT family N-acetyltransferase [Streptomyces sp. NBC_00859]|uniref:GNAT family N-acetyltransferase n=1 Tax=Streptomyces sp. NBC_00859 TaxID=2903682 RepID=UPI00386C1F5C|nr:GNAT family N-acetyltransferase [Streptomyces sp. NBC_00859]WSZ86792.1 GNAT family N-acetyltransferase [Streptomyces sp. NBC_00859]
MSSLRILSLTEAGELAPWAEMCSSADLFCTPPWLAVEQSGSGPWVPAASACLVAEDHLQLLAGVTLQQFDRTVDDDTCRVDKMLRALPCADGMSDAVLAGALLPSLMCGGWFNSTVLSSPRASEAAVTEARRELIARAVATGRDWGSASVFFPYVDAADAALRTDLRAAGFLELSAPARHVFDCDYPSHEAYLAALPSRRRVRIRKELRQFDDAGAVTGQALLDDSNVEQIATLAHTLERKYGQASTLEELTGWFSAIAKNTRTRVFTAALGGQEFAMSLWLHHENRMYGFHAGFDYDIGRGLPMYSVVGYHLPIAYGCSASDTTVLEYGISADEAKLLRGTEAMPQVLCLKPLSEQSKTVVEGLAIQSLPT